MNINSKTSKNRTLLYWDISKALAYEEFYAPICRTVVKTGIDHVHP
jgi:hypothetical protein